MLFNSSLMKELTKSLRDRESLERSKGCTDIVSFYSGAGRRKKKDVASQQFSKDTWVSSCYSAGPSTIMWHVDNESSF